MRILLINPPVSGEERYGKLSAAGSFLPPLGLAYLAAVVEKEHDVRIIDGAVEDKSVSDIAREAKEWSADLIGITVYTSTVSRSLEVVKAAKRLRPEAVTVLGGPHATALPDELIRDPSVDIVVTGEGEATFKELVAILAARGDLSVCAGIYHKRQGSPSATSARTRILDIDSIPYPARHLLPLDRYSPSPLHYRKRPAFTVMCSRGCPHRCTYCSCSKVFRGRVTLRSPENVIAEIRSLVHSYGAREVLIWDDNFGMRREWTFRFCEEIKPLGLSWSAWMRADSVDPDTLSRMSDSGCWHVSYGVESGNQRVLDAVKKSCSLDQIRNAFRWTHQAGMEARGTFILGLPLDTKDTMRETVDFAIELDADYAQFQLLALYPGTELWESADRYGETVTKDYSRSTGWFPVFIPHGLASGDLLLAHREAYRRFYLRPAYLAKRLRSLKTPSDAARYMKGAYGLLRLLFQKT